MAEAHQRPNLHTLPEDVLYSDIFPYLQRTDLFRIRCVCRQLKIYADDFIRNNFKEQEREINEDDCTLDEFIYRNLPTSKIYLNNSGPKFFEHPSIPEFLQLYATTITHIRVKEFSTLHSEHEYNFFAAFTNLHYLEIELINARERGGTLELDVCRFPDNLRNLKVLKLNEIQGEGNVPQRYASDLIEFCSNNIEYLKHPRYTDIKDGCTEYTNIAFNYVVELIGNSQREGTPLSLKFYDLDNVQWKDLFYTFRGLCDLTKVCHEHEQSIGLLNVCSTFYECSSSEFRNNPGEFCVPLVSVKNVQSALFCMELRNLEKVVITSTAECSFLQHWLSFARQPLWPKLNTLDINIDSAEIKGCIHSEYTEEPTTELLDFLIAPRNKRENLRNLRIAYSNWDLIQGAVPRIYVEDVVLACENVTNLTLSNWIGPSKDFPKFWRGLPHLENVVLEKCNTLSDASFLGENENDPTFLKLTKLKSVALKGLDMMPRVTDTAFELVFRHLKLKEFIITSALTLKSVSIAGIRSLLTGEFNNSVEKFPFHGWSLRNITVEEFSQLKCEFRASHML